MGMIKLLAAPIRSIVRFPLFQLAVVVAVILLLQAADDKSALGQIFNGLDKLVESTVGSLVLSENSIRPWIRIVSQNHRIIESNVCDPARTRIVRRRPV